MEFREATSEDVESIRAIARATWEADYPAIVSRESIREGLDEWYADGELARELGEDDAVILLALEDDEPVGFAHGVVSEGLGHLLRLYVHPGARRRGVGSALLERTVERLREAGAARLRAMVLADNELGLEFYRAAGFEATGEAETLIGGEPHAEVTLERALASADT